MLADALENIMAKKIQSFFQRVNPIIKRHKIHLTHIRAAIKIQTKWRQYKCRRKIDSASIFTFAALSIQKIFRGSKARKLVKDLFSYQRKINFIILIQRSYRGYKARLHVSMKKDFFDCIRDTKDLVALDKLKSTLLDHLVLDLEDYLKDSTKTLPLTILAVLRGILYILNGDSSDDILYFKDGITKYKQIFAVNASISSILQILRRKAKILRRLRQFIDSVAMPNPFKLYLSHDCYQYLSCLSQLKFDDSQIFDLSPLSQDCILKLYTYAMNILKLYELQKHFPDYFEVKNDEWLKSYLRLEQCFEEDALFYNAELSSKQHLVNTRQFLLENEFDLNNLDAIIENVSKSLIQSKVKMLNSKRELGLFLKIYHRNDEYNKKLLQNSQRSKELGKFVLLKELLKLKEEKSTDKSSSFIKEQFLQMKLSKVELELLDVISRLELLDENIKRNNELRNISKLLDKSKLYEYAHQLGITNAELLMIKGIWKILTNLPDSVTEKDLKSASIKLEKTKFSTKVLMKQRRFYRSEIKTELRQLYVNLLSQVLALKTHMLSSQWDIVTNSVQEFEAKEDIDAAQAEVLRLQDNLKSSFSNVSLQSPYSFQPTILLIDRLIPDVALQRILSKLQLFRFQLVNSSQLDSNLLNQVQLIFDIHHHVVLFVDRGLDRFTYCNYFGFLTSLSNALIPSPRLISLHYNDNIQPDGFGGEIFSSGHKDNNNINYLTLLTKIREISLQCRLSIGDSVHDLLNCMLSIEEQRAILEDYQLLMKELESTNCIDNINRGSMLLVASVTSILGLWKAPLLAWKDHQILYGAKMILDINGIQLSEKLYLKDSPDCSKLVAKRLEMIYHSYFPSWKLISNIEGRPFLRLLVQWIELSIEWMLKLVDLGGHSEAKQMMELKVSMNGYFDIVSAVHEIGFYSDIVPIACIDLKYKLDDPLDHLIGKLILSSFHEKYKIFDGIVDLNVEYSLGVSGRNDLLSACYSMIQTRVLPSCRLWMYFIDDFIYVITSYDKSCNLIAKMIPLSQFIIASQPTSQELLQGKPESYHFHNSIASFEFLNSLETQQLAKCITLQDISYNKSIVITRKQTLLVSRVGMISGYFTRLEVYEIRSNVYIIYVFGDIEDTGMEKALVLDIDDYFIQSFKPICDQFEERAKFEWNNSFDIANILADRVEIRLSESKIPSLGIRLTHGPGRFLGKDTLLFPLLDEGFQRVLLLVYELSSSDGEIFGLRICYIDEQSLDGIEYRISPLERKLYFNPKTPLLPQIVQRSRVIHCLHNPIRVLLPISKKFKSQDPQSLNYPIYGSHTYKISFNKDNVDKFVNKSQTVDLKESSRKVMSENIGSSIDEDLQSIYNSSSRTSPRKSPSSFFDKNSFNRYEISLETTSIDINNSLKTSWNLEFSRELESLNYSRGNLVFSIILNIPSQGFMIYIRDIFTLSQVFYFLTFEEYLRAFLENTSLISFVETISSADYEFIQGIIRELIARVDIQYISNDIDNIQVIECFLRGDSSRILLVHLEEIPMNAFPNAILKPLVEKKIQLSIINFESNVKFNLSHDCSFNCEIVSCSNVIGQLDNGTCISKESGVSISWKDNSILVDVHDWMPLAKYLISFHISCSNVDSINGSGEIMLEELTRGGCLPIVNSIGMNIGLLFVKAVIQLDEHLSNEESKKNSSKSLLGIPLNPSNNNKKSTKSLTQLPLHVNDVIESCFQGLLESSMLPMDTLSMTRLDANNVNEESNSPKIKLELPMIRDSIAEDETNELRVCWRGFVNANQILRLESSNASHEYSRELLNPLFIPKSSRLVKSYSLHDSLGSSVYVDIQYLHDYNHSNEGSFKTNTSDLQLFVIIKEVLSSGPGLIRRIFRIGVMTSNGMELGHVDLLDEPDVLLSLLDDTSSFSHPYTDLKQYFDFIIPNQLIIEYCNPKPLNDSNQNHSNKSSDLFKVYLRVLKPNPSISEDFDYKSFKSIPSLISKKTKSRNQSLLFTNIQERKYWIRIHSETKVLAGVKFQIIVLLESNNELISSFDINDFLKLYNSTFASLQDIQVIFRLKEIKLKTNSSCELKVSGNEISNYLKPTFTLLNFQTIHRRADFGRFLIQFISIRYAKDKTYKVFMDLEKLQLVAQAK